MVGFPVAKPPIAYEISVNPTGSVKDVMNQPKLFRSQVSSSPVSPRRRGARAVIVSVAALSLVVAGCSTNFTGNSSSGSQQAADQPIAGTPAQPVESPQAGSDTSGEVKSLPFPERTSVLDAATVAPHTQGNQSTSAILTKGAVYLAASNKIEQAKKVQVDDSCDNLNATASGVAVGCDGEYLELDANGDVVRKIQADGRVKSATTTADGRSVIGVDGEEKIGFYNQEGKRTNEAVVSRSLDMAVLVNGSDSAGRVAVIDRGQTTINDVDPAKEEYKATLRIGQGVGEVATGTGNDAVVVASDNRQDQVMVYTMDDVVRLHQTAPTKKSPWGVAWDTARKVALVSTTADNALTAYDIASGTPNDVGTWKTIANVRHVLVQHDGSVLLVGTDNKVQVISASDVDKTVEDGRAGANPKTKFPVELKGSEQK